MRLLPSCALLLMLVACQPSPTTPPTPLAPPPPNTPTPSPAPDRQPEPPLSPRTRTTALPDQLTQVRALDRGPFNPVTTAL
jgi:hypothetical protein